MIDKYLKKLFHPIKVNKTMFSKSDLGYFEERNLANFASIASIMLSAIQKWLARLFVGDPWGAFRNASRAFWSASFE